MGKGNLKVYFELNKEGKYSIRKHVNYGRSDTKEKVCNNECRVPQSCSRLLVGLSLPYFPPTLSPSFPLSVLPFSWDSTKTCNWPSFPPSFHLFVSSTIPQNDCYKWLQQEKSRVSESNYPVCPPPLGSTSSPSAQSPPPTSIPSTEVFHSWFRPRKPWPFHPCLSEQFTALL